MLALQAPVDACGAFATVAATHTSTSFLSCGLWAIDSCLGNCKGSCRGRLCLLPAAPDAPPSTSATSVQLPLGLTTCSQLTCHMQSDLAAQRQPKPRRQLMHCSS